jgi:hypothetical protein
MDEFVEQRLGEARKSLDLYSVIGAGALVLGAVAWAMLATSTPAARALPEPESTQDVAEQMAAEQSTQLGGNRGGGTAGESRNQERAPAGELTKIK